MKKFIYTIILILSTFALAGCAADAPQAELDVQPEYPPQVARESDISDDDSVQHANAVVSPDEEENDEQQDIPADKINGYSINPKLFEALRISPDEVAALFGEHTESTWLRGHLHRFGDTWIGGFDVASDGSLSGIATVIIEDLPNFINGLNEFVDLDKLDELFGGRISYYTVTEDSFFWIQYSSVGALLLFYEYQIFDVLIDIPPDMRAVTTRVEISI